MAERKEDDFEMFPAPSDEERQRFIESIYNYCDRWCEACSFEDRCYLRAQERRLAERHLLRGEDPDDPEIVLADIHESFRQIARMIQGDAERLGIELASGVDPEDEEIESCQDFDDKPKAEPAPVSARRAPSPLHERGMHWLRKVGELLDRVVRDLPAAGTDLDRQLNAASTGDSGETYEASMEEAQGRLRALQEALELLSRYRFLIPVKIQRALGSLAEADVQRNRGEADLAELDRAGGLRTARLVIECLVKSEGALWQLMEFHPSWRDAAFALLLETQALRSAVDAQTTDRIHYPRPGFDTTAPE